MTGKEMKLCIKDFLKHVEKLESEEDPDGCGFNREYRLIHELQVKNRRENVFKFDAGKEEQNLKKNRYKDILPYDDHRVTIAVNDDDEASDYINASHIEGVKGTGGYIASQGPLAATVNDFWQMIWEKKIEIVFMACRIVEVGKIKCKQYWHDVGTSDDFGDINVLTNSEENVSSDFIKRELIVTRGDTQRTVTQYHYSGWPDHGIPDDPAHIRDLIGLVRQNRITKTIPVLVHCSAGCGRTGAIIAIDYVWTLLEDGKLDETFSVYDMIVKFREQRMSMVQTQDQYALVYGVLKSLCEDWLTKMASHTYVNVELEQVYMNTGNDNRTEDQDDHVYEDTFSLSKSLKQMNVQTAENQSPPPKPVRTISDDMGNYVNVVLPNGNSSPTAERTKEENKVLHKTVIQIGDTKKTSQKSSADVGKSNTREHINLVRSDPRRKDGMSKALSEHIPEETGLPTLPNRRKASSVRETPRIVDIPDKPPSFDERLPRVQGPKPPPAHWNQ